MEKIGGGVKVQNALYEKMLDVAVEYEECGFLAGYRTCLKHLKEQLNKHFSINKNIYKFIKK